MVYSTPLLAGTPSSKRVGTSGHTSEDVVVLNIDINRYTT